MQRNRPVAADLKCITLAIQCKEYSESSAAGADLFSPSNRNSRQQHFEWKTDGTGATVKMSVEQHDLVFLVVSPNTFSAGQVPATWTVYGQECYEAVWSHEDVRAWSPTVAYSACDARVLAQNDN